MKRTAHMVEESKEKEASSKLSTASIGARKGRGNKKGQTPPQTLRALKLHAWKPGQSGNPGGRPKNDFAKEIAQAIFEKNPEALYRAYAKAMLKGNPYAFQVLADRAFGKISDKLEVTTEKDLLDALMAGRKRALAKKKDNAS